MKKFLLLCLGVASIMVFFLLPPYRSWVKERIFAYYHDFTWQRKKMDIQQRMAYRFKGSYIYSKQIADFFEKKRMKSTALVLIPPTDYFSKYGLDYHVPEPLVFYYYTGLRTIWPNSVDTAKANFYAHVKDKRIVIDSIANRAAFSDSLKAFNKFNISL